MISIIITTKNRLDFLKRAVKSVVENNYQPDEIVVVNDGGEKITSLSLPIDCGIHLIIINHPVSLGGNIARNRGVTESNGDILFFLDDDDALDKGSIRARVECFYDDSVGMAYTGKKFVYSDDLENVFRKSLPKLSGSCYESLLTNGNGIGSTSCVAVKRDVFIEAGKFDENLCALQDYDLWIRVAKLSQVAHDQKALLFYTIHRDTNQISSDYNKYLVAGNYLAAKYKESLFIFDAFNKFIALRYLRVAISASKSNSFIRFKYAFLSFLKRPTLKSLFLMLPVGITKFFKVLS